MKFKRRYKQSTIKGHLHHQLHHFFLERKGVPANLFLVNSHTRNCRPSFNLAIDFSISIKKKKNDSIQKLAKLHSVSNIQYNPNSQKQTSKKVQPSPKMLNVVPCSMNAIVPERSFNFYLLRHPHHVPLT